MEYEPGDIVSRRKGIVMHRGLVLDDDRVYHNTPSNGEHVSTIEEFRKNKRMYVRSMDDADRQAALRSYSNPTGRNYNLFTNNCEHTISRGPNGKGRSPQLASFLISGGVAAATLVLTRSVGLAVAGFAITKRLTERKKPIEVAEP